VGIPPRLRLFQNFTFWNSLAYDLQKDSIISALSLGMAGGSYLLPVKINAIPKDLNIEAFPKLQFLGDKFYLSTSFACPDPLDLGEKVGYRSLFPTDFSPQSHRTGGSHRALLARSQLVLGQARIAFHFTLPAIED
jgi:hypothetical protein